ncbi:o-succinylbenzoate--CoA ligase [Shewanella sedimentimangrovi]|uniref:O-succinylbenzoate--CoA ligase n=1 Tax=Shewanella sedimentimangrovi TaxID=2814293 RepID=A0ABX7QZZ2_9GAMM|nr:o-succinylbenzoate--CoA ligase [Shewanella sedimentimangrovi]QSX37124.1 o-succinylbenzoate--CoA ligase [Shewanella sedimentimangrovi]
MLAGISPLHRMAGRQPEAIAVIAEAHNGKAQICETQNSEIQLNYGELSHRVLATAAALKQAQIKRLGVIGPNSLEQIILYWACVDAGSLFCPLSWRLPEAQLAQLAAELRLDALSLDTEQDLKLNGLSVPRFPLPNLPLPNFASSAFEPPTPEPIDPLRPVNLILTSGSSGKPKAALHCLNNHMASAEGAASLIPLSPGDRWLLSLPLFHIGGLAIVNRCALAGATLVLPSTLGLAKDISRFQISHLSLVMTQLRKLLAEGPDALGSVKALLLGGSALAPDLLTRLKKLNVRAFGSYGMTEMSSQITTGRVNEEGHSGHLLPGRELRLVDGEIQLKGPCLFLGYLEGNKINLPLTADGWFASGDLGWLDEQGRLHVNGRKDNMFVCGGENLQPEEVEAALKQHPEIEEALVFGAEDAEFGLLPQAILRCSEGCQNTMPSQAQLDAFLAPRLARFKRPRRYHPWPELMDSGLKPNRKALIAAVKAKS